MNIGVAAALAKALGGGGSSPSGGGGLVVHATVEDGEFVLDKTWQEIYDAVKTGVSAVVMLPSNVPGNPDDALPVVYCGEYAFGGSDYTYVVGLLTLTEAYGGVYCYKFESETASDYPVYS